MADVRLIDANALLKSFDVAKMVEYDETGCGVTRIAIPVQTIKDALTIDAVPVVHGRWACDEDFNTVCTACGKFIPTFHCYNEETDEEWDEPIDKTPFCPNCGAKMDGGAEG